MSFTIREVFTGSISGYKSMSNSQQDDKPEEKSGQTTGDQFNFYGGNQKGVFGSHGVYNEGIPAAAEIKQGPKLPAPSAVDAPEGGVFISYSRRDADTYVIPAVKRLYEQKITLWWDQANIPPGANWRDELESALQKSAAGILFVSSNSLQSKIVRDEYRYFLNNSKPLIPVLCEMVSLPAELQNINYVIYTDFDRVLRILQDLLSTE
jgi:hypothetical protein